MQVCLFQPFSQTNPTPRKFSGNPQTFLWIINPPDTPLRKCPSTSCPANAKQKTSQLVLGGLTNRQTDRQTDRETDRQTERQRDRETERHRVLGDVIILQPLSAVLQIIHVHVQMEDIVINTTLLIYRGCKLNN